MSLGKKALFGLLVILVIGVALVSSRYLDFTVRDLLYDKGDLLDSFVYMSGFYGHVIFGLLALLSGPMQFLPGFRLRRLKLHRNLGKIYVIACLLSGICGLYIAQYASTGMIAGLGFSFLALGWLLTTAMAYSSIRRSNVDAHRIWMIRSYALTFAAVTLRLYLGPSTALGIPFDLAYPIISWMCWVPNIIIAELVFVRPLLRARKAAGM